MKRWRLADSKGSTLSIVEAEDRAVAQLIGLTTFPDKYSHVVNLEIEEAKTEADLVELKRAYERGFTID
jgi:hypothetical protein